MKKIIISAILVFVLILALSISYSVFASGSITPSPRSLSITKGGTASFRITASNACGRVDISSSNSSVASVNMSSQWLENNSVTVTVTGVSAGSASISVRLSDAATFDEEELSGSYTVSVTVSEPQQETPSTPSGGSSNSGSTSNNSSSNSSSNTSNASSNNNSNNKTNTNNNKNTEEENLSKNNSLKTLSVEGYEIKNIEGNTYELEVMNNVEKINIIAETEDSKATVTGIGEKELQLGLNTFEIVVKSESGSTNTYTIKVTRKDAYYLEDLNTVLTDEKITEAEIIINKDTTITVEQLQQIKNSKKKVTLKVKDEEKIVCIWKLDGSKMNNIAEFKTGINFTSENINKIDIASNYADGMILNFEHSGNLPEGTRVKIYVGNKYKDGEEVNVYFFNPNKNDMELIERKLAVKDGYIEFEIKHCSEYFVTKSIINNIVEQNSNINIYMILFIISTALLVLVIVLDVFKINPILKINRK